MLAPVAAVAEQSVAMNAADENGNGDKMVDDESAAIGTAVAVAAVDADDEVENPSYPVSALSPLSTI